MPAGIAVAVMVALVALVGLAMGVMTATAARRRRLQQRFGPEYDRLAGERDSKRKAGAELVKRERRVRDLGIRPLTDSARAGYTRQWATLQERFADSPADAVAGSQELVAGVMNERGYPTDDRDQLLADLSVEHAKALDHYRAAEEISESTGAGTASTEHLRQAMIHYREVFRELLGGPAGPSGPGFPGRSSPGWPGAGQPSRPAAAPPGRMQSLARAASPAGRARDEDGLAGGQAQAVLTQAPPTGRERAAGLGGQVTVERAGEPADPVWQQVEDLWDADPIRPAERVLAEAHGKAAEVVTTAERKAAEITRSAAEQAAATITRAEREAAELRAAATKMTAELAGMTADVVASPRREAAENLTRPAKPSTRPGPRPGISPRRTPSARPGAKPKRRQVRTWRKMVAAVVVLSLGGLTSTATEIGLHGFRFFIFRSAGTGATPGTGVQENQGPGQPGAHLKAQENKPDGKAG